MTRYFEVKVTSCWSCPDFDDDRCHHLSVIATKWDGSYTLYQENKDQLTPTCPMWNETKESETK